MTLNQLRSYGPACWIGEIVFIEVKEGFLTPQLRRDIVGTIDANNGYLHANKFGNSFKCWARLIQAKHGGK